MELTISKNSGIREIKKQFNRCFPFLKVEFYVYNRSAIEGSHITDEPYYGLYLAETSDFFKEGILSFSPTTTVAELKLQFQVELGLVAKIFRKSGAVWVDTWQTSHLTLGRQNSMGAASSRPMGLNRYTLLL